MIHKTTINEKRVSKFEREQVFGKVCREERKESLKLYLITNKQSYLVYVFIGFCQ